jgi:transcriptional regulator with XRE-family HTH domain
MTNSLGGETPAVARQRVRRWLRQARQKTALTQTDIATRLGWSLSKVQRIESGEVAVSETDLRAVLDIFRVSDAQVVAALVKDARLARRERWTTDPSHLKYLSPGLRRLMQFETVATQIRSYQPLLLPGILQTAATAKYIIEIAGGSVTEDGQNVRFEVRRRRRKDVIERADGPMYYLVIDESVILRNVGGIRNTAEQLEDLAETAILPKVSVRVVPLDEPKFVRIGVMGIFSLINLSDDDADDSVLYRERFIDDELDHDAEKIRPYRDGFEELWKLALPEDASLRLIQAKAADLRTRLDRLPAIVE